MAAAKTWWRVITDPMTGAIVKFGQNKYRPTAAQRAALKFRDGGCCTPGCPGRVEHCDADHVQEWHEGGGTDLGNLEMRCRRCHRLKSMGLLHFEQAADGSTVVTSLFGTRQGTTPCAPWAEGMAPSTRDADPVAMEDSGVPGAADELPDQQSASREWGKVEDVPDPSCEDPEFGRYAKSSHAKGARKRRLKRNAGGYGPRKANTQGSVDPWECHSGTGDEGTDDIPF
jgi:HNH endonuclease.